MVGYGEVFKIFKDSLGGADFYLYVSVIFIHSFLVIGYILFFMLGTAVKRKDNAKMFSVIFGIANTCYVLFCALYKIMPLIGVINTICRLLVIAISMGEINNILYEAILTLTSTGWGIIMYVYLKLWHVVLRGQIERTIKECKQA